MDLVFNTALLEEYLAEAELVSVFSTEYSLKVPRHSEGMFELGEENSALKAHSLRSAFTSLLMNKPVAGFPPFSILDKLVYWDKTIQGQEFWERQYDFLVENQPMEKEAILQICVWILNDNDPI